ncbi:MAG: hypothetical protein AAFR42_11320 [Cyanobacteria bacterium J06628_6]
MRTAPQKTASPKQYMTMEEYLAYEDCTDTRYELVDGAAHGLPEWVNGQYEDTVYADETPIRSAVLPSLNPVWFRFYPWGTNEVPRQKRRFM